MRSSAPVQAFVVNLDQSSERLQAITQQASAVGLNLTRVPGVLGRAVDPQAEPAVDPTGYAMCHGRRINLNEVGCYLSHLKALQAFLDSGAPYGLILEDDAGLPPGYLELIDALISKNAAWDIVKLSAFHSGTPLAIEPLGNGIRLVYCTVPAHECKQRAVFARRGANHAALFGAYAVAL